MKHVAGYRLRWSKNPSERFFKGGHTLKDANGTRFAVVQSIRTGGWFWVAGWEAQEHGVPHRNTSSTPVETVEQAKAEALTFVKAALVKP